LTKTTSGENPQGEITMRAQRALQPAGLPNLKKGTYSIYGEKIDWSYYDTETISNSVSSISLFTVPEAGTKTKDLTNMSAAGQIPTGQHFTIKAIKMMYKAVSGWTSAEIEKWYALLAGSTMEFKIQGKDSQLVLTLQELLGACSLLSIIPAATYNLPIILPRYHGIYPLNNPIVLAEQTQFSVKITHTAAPAAALAGDLLKISLNGILKRRS
jgi:hypothetical protein